MTLKIVSTTKGERNKYVSSSFILLLNYSYVSAEAIKLFTTIGEMWSRCWPLPDQPQGLHHSDDSEMCSLSTGLRGKSWLAYSVQSVDAHRDIEGGIHMDSTSVCFASTMEHLSSNTLTWASFWCPSHHCRYCWLLFDEKPLKTLSPLSVFSMHILRIKTLLVSW